MKVENPTPSAARNRPARPAPGSYEAPRFEVICLACEISAYAPDEDGPLF